METSRNVWKIHQETSKNLPWTCPGRVWPSLGPWAGPWALGRARPRAQNLRWARAGPGPRKFWARAGPGPGPAQGPKGPRGPRLGQPWPDMARHARTCPGVRKRSMGVRKNTLHGVTPEKKSTRKNGVPRTFKSNFLWGHPRSRKWGASRGDTPGTFQCSVSLWRPLNN